jgi:soluble lytic murein transglycosylase
MAAGESGLARYLTRFLDADDHIWVKRWREQFGNSYTRLGRASQWPDQEKSRVITSAGLKQLARNKPDLAWKVFEKLQGHILWSEEVRGGILREIALWSAVDGADDTSGRMHAVPQSDRDEKLMEWWVRFGLSRENWAEVIVTIAAMPGDLRSDAQWRYWEARAHLNLGETEKARELFISLAQEANYYGFLSADFLDQTYSICPQSPMLNENEIESLRQQPGISRAVELHRAGIRNWARSEWGLATRELEPEGLRLAAAIARQENWPDMVIFALGKSGDLNWYDWRFPVEFGGLAERHARGENLDLAWVMGLMRSESAMAEDALSSAGARGLMQLMPDTARQLARRNNIPYAGSGQLLQADENIRLGTAYLRELLDRFEGNTVLASGAYNAGPGAVKRWLKTQNDSDPAIWVETLPYFETRDYIPRVLAFSTIYDWRLQLPVRRISSRMPALDSGSMAVDPHGFETTEVVCRASG